MKKIVWLSILLLVLLLPVSAFAYTDSASGLEYDIFNDYAVIVKGSYTGTDYAIPKTITHGGKAYPVTSIEKEAFKNCTALTSITIPDSVSRIGEYAFAGCTGLTSIDLPNSIRTIDGWAFSGCEALTSITIPKGVTCIEEHTFENCTSLKRITLPDELTMIRAFAFYNCPSLEEITFPKKMNIIDEHAFFNCTSLQKATITGDNLKFIGNHAFDNCQNLESFDLPDNLDFLGEKAFSHCEKLTSVHIPGTVSIIGESTFQGCKALTSVTIGSGITNIGATAFQLCESLTSVTLPDSLTLIASNAFANTNLKSITIPASVDRLGDDVFIGCTDLTITIMYDKAKHFGTYTFEGITNVKIIHKLVPPASAQVHPSVGSLIASWDEIALAKEYEVQLYKDSVDPKNAIGKPMTTHERGIDLYSLIKDQPAFRTYCFTVISKASGYVDSEPSVGFKFIKHPLMEETEAHLPQTGDTAPIALWVALLVLSAAGIVVLKRRKV